MGLIPRLAALTSPERVAASISEDGYLMLTVARNIADGRGLSTAAGTIPTNGVQPLVTFLWAGVHAVTASDAAALRLVLVLELLIAVMGAWAVGRLARVLFAAHDDPVAVGQLAGAAWFAAPVALRHTTNGLETGLYAATIAAVLLLDARWRDRPSLARDAIVGAGLGLAVLVRNDAAFLVAAYCLVRVFSDRTRLAPALVAGAASVIVASPWLIFNQVRFGSIVPISGRSQSLDAVLGENLAKVPRTLAEYVFAGLPLPDAAAVPGVWPVALALIVVTAVALAWRRGASFGLQPNRTWAVLSVFILGLSVYYGAFFAAGHFLSRYLFPVSLVTFAFAGVVLDQTRGGRPTVVGSAAALAWVVLAGVADIRFVQRAGQHPHMHVVRWVQANVADEEWVAAPQSGTVGYFHDRTINLDGKTNPAALRARDERRLFHYVVDDTPARYIVDWYGLSRWMDQGASVTDDRDPGILPTHFRYRVKDPRRNLVVLERLPHTREAH